jgi:hypothetical protein
MPVIGGFGLLVMALWVFCLVDVITSNEFDVRNLPKMGWMVVVLLLPLIGSILWLVAGRPQTAGVAPRREAPTRFPEYDRPGRQVAQRPDDDDEFLRRCRERAEEQRWAAKERPPIDEES